MNFSSPSPALSLLLAPLLPCRLSALEAKAQVTPAQRAWGVEGRRRVAMGSKQLRWCFCGSPCLMSPGYGGSSPRSHTVLGFRAAGPSFCRTGLSLGSCRRGSVPGIFSGSFSTFILKQKCCSVAQLCLTLCDPMDCSTPGFPDYLPEFVQAHVH